jgi:hypothetical protein
MYLHFCGNKSRSALLQYAIWLDAAGTSPNRNQFFLHQQISEEERRQKFTPEIL